LDGGDHHEEEVYRGGMMLPESGLKWMDEVRVDRVDTSFKEDTLE
jgi:hypothetical protein